MLMITKMMSVCQTFGNEKTIILDYDGMKFWHLLSSQTVVASTFNLSPHVSRADRSGFEIIKLQKNSQQMLSKLTLQRNSRDRKRRRLWLKSVLASSLTQFEFSEALLEVKHYSRIRNLYLPTKSVPWSTNERDLRMSKERNHRRNARLVARSLCCQKILLIVFSANLRVVPTSALRTNIYYRHRALQLYELITIRDKLRNCSSNLERQLVDLAGF